jgi:tetratricopeptide (TPR) repeat protein
MVRRGFLPDEAPALVGELQRLIARPLDPGEAGLRFAEFRRIRAEGLALLDEGRAGMAAFFFERALELCPEFYTVQALLAEAYRTAGRAREAATAYGRYLAAEPLPCDRETIVRQVKTLASAP